MSRCRCVQTFDWYCIYRYPSPVWLYIQLKYFTISNLAFFVQAHVPRFSKAIQLIRYTLEYLIQLKSISNLGLNTFLCT